MTIPDRLRLPLAFDPVLLARDLANLAGTDWIAHFVTQNYEGDWSVLPLRADAAARHPVMMIYSSPTTTEFVDTPFLQASPYFREALAAFHCPLQTVRLMRLTPGSVIKEHRDPDLAYEQGNMRIHVAIATNPQVEFELNGSRVMLEAGQAWYLRLSDPHRVVNRGTTDRVHLVIDATINDWAAAMMQQALTQQELAVSRATAPV